jgi:hypothetical protein
MDDTEEIRKQLIHEINSRLPEDKKERYLDLVCKYGAENVFDTEALQKNFIAEGFMAPFVVVRRRSDNKKGVMQFCHSPRFYFDFQEA